MSIPVEIDIPALLDDLRRWGWRDQKIEVLLGFPDSYVRQLRSRKIIAMGYQRAARLYNLWESERDCVSNPIEAEQATT